MPRLSLAFQSLFDMDVVRALSSAFNVHTTDFCLYTALLLVALYLFKTNPRSAPSKAALLSQIAASSAVYGRAAVSMLKPSAEHRQRLRSTDAWKKVEEVERDLGHSQHHPSSPASDSDFMLPSKIVTRHLHVALTSDSDTFNLYTCQHNLLVGCIQWLSSPTQSAHFDVAKQASQVQSRTYLHTQPLLLLFFSSLAAVHFHPAFRARCAAASRSLSSASACCQALQCTRACLMHLAEAST